MEKIIHKLFNFPTCILCSYRSKSSFVMYKHERLHEKTSKTAICFSTTMDMLECEFCGFKTNLKVDLTEHFHVFHEGKEANELGNILKFYCCKNCEFDTHSMLVLAKHIEYCERRKHELKAHINSSEIKWFQCAQCHFKTKEDRGLKRHILSKHNNPENVNWFKCVQCDHKSLQKCNLKFHIKAKHTNQKFVSWYECKQCTYKTKQIYYLKNHVACKHGNPEDIRWFPCTRCAFKCTVEGNLKRHNKRMHGPFERKWLQCEHCPFTSKMQYHLKMHMERHNIIIKYAGFVNLSVKKPKYTYSRKTQQATRTE